MGSKLDSCKDTPWQATFPSLLHNLADKWTKAADPSFRSCQQEPKTLTTEATFVMCVILIFLLLNVIGSSINAYESYRKSLLRKNTVRKVKDEDVKDALAEKKVKEIEFSTISVWKEKCRTFFDCFCVQDNARKLLSVVSKKGYLNYIDGIRAILFVYIFSSHFLYFYSRSIKNPNKHLHALLKLPLTELGANSVFGVDAFITLSGFLNGYFFTDYFKKNNGKIPWVAFYALRILRLTPVYMILLGFYSTLFTYMSSSPVWPTYNTNPVCKKTWIWNLLYLNNFNSNYNQCMTMTWYLACIMQLYIISPLFMIPLNRWPKIGYAFSLVTICISSFAAFTISKQYNLFATLPKILPKDNAMEELNRRVWLFIDELHQKTYVRLGPYVTGILLGYYLQKRTLTRKNSLLALSFGWLLSVILILVSFFALSFKEETVWEAAVFNGVRDILFSCGFAWILFVCSTEQGGVVGTFLSRPIFKPISRLSFCGLLTQAIVLEAYFLSVEVFVNEAIIYQGLLVDISWILLIIRLLFWTLVSAFVVFLLFESPLTRLLQLFFTSK